MSLVRNRLYSVQTHALFQNYMLSFLFLNQTFNFSSHLIKLYYQTFISVFENCDYICFAQTIKYRDIFRMLSESSFIELSIFRFGVRVFYCRVRDSQTRVRARVRVFPESGFFSRVRVRSGFRSMPFLCRFEKTIWRR